MARLSKNHLYGATTLLWLFFIAFAAVMIARAPWMSEFPWWVYVGGLTLMGLMYLVRQYWRKHYTRDVK